MKNSIKTAIIVAACILGFNAWAQKKGVSASADQTLTTSKKFNNAKPDGPFEEKDQKGNVLVSGEYKSNKRIGLWKYYFADGKQKSTTNFNAEGAKEGEEIIYTAKGEVQERAEYKAGKKNGKHVTYNAGKLYSETTYVNGNIEGAHAIYFSSGKKQLEGNYINNGMRDGEWKSYDETGKVIEKHSYKSGVEQ